MRSVCRTPARRRERRGPDPDLRADLFQVLRFTLCIHADRRNVSDAVGIHIEEGAAQNRTLPPSSRQTESSSIPVVDPVSARRVGSPQAGTPAAGLL